VRSWIVTAAVAYAALGCGDSAGRQPADTGGDTVAPATVREPTPPISIQHERDFELTGDSIPETVRVAATGSKYDSLNVRFEVRSRDGSVMYADRWGSQLYFVYEDRGQFSDADVLRKVRGHLQRIVHDSSYFDPRSGRPRPMIFQVDTGSLTYSIAEHNWRDRNALPDTAALPMAAHDEIRGGEVRADRVQRLTAELPGQPAFTYFAGGEANYTIAWSRSERRFFTIWQCC
jgi:hypothetical protein